MRKRIAIFFFLTALVSLCTYAARVQQEQYTLSTRLIRLHVVANSDSIEDQSVKLAVRDCVLTVIKTVTADCESRDEACAALLRATAILQACAEQRLAQLGHTEAVRVTLCREPFPCRSYQTFSLPAGSYDTLRITIGSGAGHNWWCVAFPALCLPATTEEFIETAELSGLSESQTDLLSGEDVTVELKFKLLDWLEALFGNS